MRGLRSTIEAAGLGALVCALVLSVAANVGAQDRQRARQLYAEAQALFESGQYAAAESSFRAAYEAMPNPVVLKAIASAQEQQGNISGALETLRRYLRDAPPDAPDRAEVEQRVRELSSRPATVAISSTPPGASIVVDGEDSGQTTPAEVTMSAGEHTVELRLTGYAPATQTFEAQAATRVRLEMALQEAAAGEGPDAFGTEGGDGAGAEESGGGDDGGGSADPSAGVWVTAGIGAAGLISGTVFGFLALSEQSNFDSEPANDTADRGEAFALVADISFGVAAAMAITSLVLYIVESSSGGDDEQSADLNGDELRLAVGAHADNTGGGVAVQLRF